MYRLYLSFRFLMHHWLMTLIGSFFVGASLVILVVVMSVMDGFQEKLKDTIRGSSADLIVTPKFPADVGRLEDALEEALGTRVVAAGPYFQTITLSRKQGAVDRAREETYHVAVICGVDGRKEARINRFGQYVTSTVRESRDAFLDAPFAATPEERDFGTVGLIVGKDLLRDMNVREGEKIRLYAIVPTRTEGGNGGASKEDFELRDELFQVVGTYASENSEYDKRWVFMDHQDFGEFFDASTARPSVRMKLETEESGMDTDEAFQDARGVLANRLTSIARQSLPPGSGLRTEDLMLALGSWRSEQATLVKAIETEKSMILSIAFLIVIAGASSIFAAQWLLVTDKVREIGILRALGAGVGGITIIFVMNGFLMGLLGSIGGALIGLWAVREIDSVHEVVSWITGRPVFNPDIYLFEKIPTKVDPEQVVNYAVAALICTLIASAIPALRAGMMDPAEALHRD